MAAGWGGGGEGRGTNSLTQLLTISKYNQCSGFRLCQNMWQWNQCQTPARFNSVQSLDRLAHRGGGGGGMRDDTAETFFQSCLREEAIVSSFGHGQDVHSPMLSIQQFLCRPQQFQLRRRNLRGVREDWRAREVTAGCSTVLLLACSWPGQRRAANSLLPLNLSARLIGQP